MQNNDLFAKNANAPLIRVEQSDTGNLLVSARELHAFLQSSERFSKWIERMLEYGFVENQDYTLYQKVHPQNKQVFDDYALTLDTAKEIAMVQRSEKGKQARQYFIDCEKQLNENVQLQRPLSMAEILLKSSELLVNLEKNQLSHEARLLALEAKSNNNVVLKANHLEVNMDIWFRNGLFDDVCAFMDKMRLGDKWYNKRILMVSFLVMYSKHSDLLQQRTFTLTLRAYADLRGYSCAERASNGKQLIKFAKA